jgi:hypothetical protein
MTVAQLPRARAQPLLSALDRKAEPDLARAAIQTLELESVQALLQRKSCRRTTICRPNWGAFRNSRQTLLANTPHDQLIEFSSQRNAIRQCACACIIGEQLFCELLPRNRRKKDPSKRFEFTL